MHKLYYIQCSTKQFWANMKLTCKYTMMGAFNPVNCDYRKKTVA